MAAAELSGPRAGTMRFSGHETFACRYAWLPKAYRGLAVNPALFADEDAAITELGLGKNMVRALRFWAEVMGVARPEGRALQLTEFAHEVFGPKGHDRFIEDVRTLWLLHWKLASRHDNALFAWRFLLNHWAYPELTRTEALAAFTRESLRLGHSHSEVTLSQHLDVFLHTYHPARGSGVGLEDSLDGPLVELSLLQAIGERRSESGRFETVFAFRREPKREISAALFGYCLADYWARFRPNEETLTLREVTVGVCSPGQIFKLPEDDVRTRLEAYGADPRSPFSYQPSAVQGLLSRRKGVSTPTLAEVYEEEMAYA
ncbi:MAG: DUF4007 family protein [Allosphingosinicella sp.]|uniref:DUF4007 family protein n=1 Tax=Allosphingosinicella sp. TaxID=2823234 RepID=UPI00394A354C